MAAHAAHLREYGEYNGIVELTTRKLSTTEEQCWEFTALATKNTDSMGFASDYEYHLRLVDGVWLVENLFYIDGSEKFEML